MKEYHQHEKLIIDNFFSRGRKERYYTIRNNKQKRSKWLDKLNHNPGLDPRYTSWVDSKADIIAILKAKGASRNCFVISCSDEIDLKEMDLIQAFESATLLGWGTVIGCVPGKLAYYYGEMGESRAILERKS